MLSPMMPNAPLWASSSLPVLDTEKWLWETSYSLTETLGGLLARAAALDQGGPYHGIQPGIQRMR